MKNIELVGSDDLAVMIDALNEYIRGLDEIEEDIPSVFEASILPVYRHKAKVLLGALVSESKEVKGQC